MIGRKLIVVIAAIVALAGGVLLGLYGLGLGPFAPASTGQEPVANADADAGSASKPPAEPEATTNAPEAEAPKPQANATGAPTPPSEPTSVPTFDVVVIEPNGEGVIAGRAAPGWKVSVQSEGAKVAEAKANGGFVISFHGQEQVLNPHFAEMLLDSTVKARGGSGAPTAADSAALRQSLPALVASFVGTQPDSGSGPTQCHDITLYPGIGLGGGACEGCA